MESLVLVPHLQYCESVTNIALNRVATYPLLSLSFRSVLKGLCNSIDSCICVNSGSAPEMVSTLSPVVSAL